jgi:hypothetical protein
MGRLASNLNWRPGVTRERDLGKRRPAKKVQFGNHRTKVQYRTTDTPEVAKKNRKRSKTISCLRPTPGRLWPMLASLSRFSTGSSNPRSHSLSETILFAPFALLVYLSIGFCSTPTFGTALTFPWCPQTQGSNITSLRSSIPIPLSTSRLTRPTAPFITARHFLRPLVYNHHCHPYTYVPLLLQIYMTHTHRPLSEQHDIHARLMSMHKEVPDWWYLTIFSLHHLFSSYEKKIC